MYNIEEMPKSRVIYMRKIGAYGEENYGLMQAFKKWAKDNGLFTEASVILGISHDDPNITPPESCRYDVCMIVGDDYEITDFNIKEAKLPGGKYAVFTIEHTPEEIKKAWEEVFFKLLQKPDFSRPIIERYAKAMVNNNLCEICVPVLS